MCHLILSTCKNLSLFDFNTADRLDFYHNCFFQTSCACRCKSVLHSLFTFDFSVYSAPSPASAIWHVYLPSPQAFLDLQYTVCMWNLFSELICKAISLSASKAFQRPTAVLTPAETISLTVLRLYYISWHFLFKYNNEHFVLKTKMLKILT